MKQVTSTDRAAAWLATRLAAGPLLSRFVRAEAKRAGVPLKSLRAAANVIGVEIHRQGWQAEAIWALPAVNVQQAPVVAAPAASSNPSPGAVGLQPVPVVTESAAEVPVDPVADPEAAQLATADAAVEAAELALSQARAEAWLARRRGGSEVS